MSVPSLAERLIQRSASLGRLGVAMHQAAPQLPDDFCRWGLARQYAYVYTCYAKEGPVAAAAVSTLACDATVQVPYSFELCLWTVRNAYELPTTPVYQEVVHEWKDGGLPPKDWLRLKAHPAAASKTNVYFRQLVRSALKYDRTAYTSMMRWRKELWGMSNDQGCAAVMYARAIEPYYGDDAWSIAIAAIKQPDNAKAVSSSIKALGQAAEFGGAVLAEANCLLGRGVSPIDVGAEATLRATGHGTPAPDIFPDDLLRSCIRELLHGELDMDRLEFKDVNEFWENRWAWCVNGGHSRLAEKHDKRWLVAYKGQVHRRVAIESWKLNPLLEWDGKVYVSPSSKLEHGKTRLLLACDTVSYVAFEHIMQGVERAWKGRRIVLDPGQGGAAGIARRVRNMTKGACYAALDYDDFNSQHTLRAQEILFEELIEVTGYPELMGKRLVDSFRKMLICVGGVDVGYAHSTLMSGHRCTTFINSMLNAAYIMCANPQLFRRLKSIHVGDDVMAACAGPGEAEELITSMSRTICRMNPTKQSIGIVSGEFLRMAISKKHAIGYVARTIASAVSGNWTSDLSLTPDERARSIIVQCRSLANRSGGRYACTRLLVHAASKRTGIPVRHVINLLEGRTTLGPGPVYEGDNTVREFSLVDERKKYQMRGDNDQVDHNATTDYLTYAATSVERWALQQTKVSVENAMIDASYTKSVVTQAGTTGDCSSYRFRFERAYRLPGSCTEVEALGMDKWTGVLGRYPILQLLKQRMSKATVRTLINEIAPELKSMPLEVAAWGYDSVGYRLVGVLPYSDAASICSRVAYGVVYVSYNVYM